MQEDKWPLPVSLMMMLKQGTPGEAVAGKSTEGKMNRTAMRSSGLKAMNREPLRTQRGRTEDRRQRREELVKQKVERRQRAELTKGSVEHQRA